MAPQPSATVLVWAVHAQYQKVVDCRLWKQHQDAVATLSCRPISLSVLSLKRTSCSAVRSPWWMGSILLGASTFRAIDLCLHPPPGLWTVLSVASNVSYTYHSALCGLSGGVVQYQKVLDSPPLATITKTKEEDAEGAERCWGWDQSHVHRCQFCGFCAILAILCDRFSTLSTLPLKQHSEAWPVIVTSGL